MARSYKHSPVAKLENDKFFKKWANRVVRRRKEVPSGKAYKKLFDSYNICDFKCLISGDWVERLYKGREYQLFMK
jgi:hypothetical protein